MLAVGLPQFGHAGCSPWQVRELCPPSPHTVHAMQGTLARIVHRTGTGLCRSCGADPPSLIRCDSRVPFAPVRAFRAAPTGGLGRAAGRTVPETHPGRDRLVAVGQGSPLQPRFTCPSRCRIQMMPSRTAAESLPGSRRPRHAPPWRAAGSPRAARRLKACVEALAVTGHLGDRSRQPPNSSTRSLHPLRRIQVRLRRRSRWTQRCPGSPQTARRCRGSKAEHARRRDGPVSGRAERPQ